MKINQQLDRRQYLQGIGVAVGLIKNRQTPTVHQATSEPPTSWTQFQRTTTNTGYVQTRQLLGDAIEVIWSEEAEIDRSPVTVDGVIYGSTSWGVKAVDAETGDNIWEFDGEFTGTPPPAVVDGSVYVGEYGGDKTTYSLVSLSTDDGTIEWEFEAQSRIRSPPTVANGTVYIGDTRTEGLGEGEIYGGVYAIDVDTGELEWHASDPREYSGSTIDSAIAVADGLLHTGLYALDPEDGSMEWAAEGTGRRIETAPTVNDGVVYGGTDEGLVALAAADGSEQWVSEPTGRIVSAPAVDGETAYFGTRDTDTVYAVSLEDGSVLWEFDVPNNIHYSPVVTETELYVSPLDGPLYALSKTNGDVLWTFDGAPQDGPIVIDSLICYPGRENFFVLSPTESRPDENNSSEEDSSGDNDTVEEPDVEASTEERTNIIKWLAGAGVVGGGGYLTYRSIISDDD